MPIFEYRVRDKKADNVRGMVDAVSEEAVAALLVEKGLTIISIERRRADSLLDAMNFIGGKVTTKDLVVFFRQMAVMIDAGMPVVKALRTLVRQTQNKKLKATIAGLADEVEGGITLSGAMEDFPHIFNNFYINIIKSGESTGGLSNVLDYLADQKEKDYDLESSIKGEMIYPVFIICALFVVAFILLTFVMPKMMEMIRDSGADLPATTQLLMSVSGFFASYWILILAAVVAAALWLVYYFRTSRGKVRLDHLQINIPVFGPIFRYIYIVRMCRSLSTLLKGGVPIALGLQVVRDVVSNSVYYDIISQTMREVAEGNSMSDALVVSKHMPVMVSQMIAVGEEIGKVEEILDKLADFYSREISNRVHNLSKMIEPVVMIILGIVVAVFISAIILPVWQLSNLQ